MRSKFRRQSRPSQEYQSLEQRRLLAGNVAVFQFHDIAYIRGDRSDNQIEVVANDSGEVVVRGVNGTSINHEDEVVLDTSDSTIGSLRVNLGRGDDTFFAEGIHVEGRAYVRGGSGNDNVGFYEVSTGRDLVAITGRGDDSVSLDDVSVGGRLVAYTGQDADVVGIDNSTISGRTLVATGRGADRLAIKDSQHIGSVHIYTGANDDFVSLDGVTIERFAGLQTQSGNDDVVVEDTSFNRLRAGGGRGFDSLEAVGDGNEFNGSASIRSFEGDNVADETERRDEVFSDLITSGARLGTIAELAALTPDLSTLLGALQATGLDAAVAGEGPLTVFAPLNSAFAEISDVVEGLTLEQLSDVLTFHVAAGSIFASELVTQTSVDTLLGQSFSVEIIDGEVILNGDVTLAATDIRAKNGVIHLLNNVLIPGA